MSYSSVILADSPAGYYPLNEASGTTAHDQSGNGVNGTYSGSYTLGNAGILPGSTDTCVNFTGGQMVVPDAAPNRLGIGPMSFEFWLHLSSLASYAVLLDGGVTGPQRFYTMMLNAAGNASASYDTAGNHVSGTFALSSPITTGNLLYLVYTFGAVSVTEPWNVYLNSVNVSSTGQNMSGATNNSHGFSLFGNPSGDGGGLLQGNAQEMALYNYELSSAQVLAHYNAGLQSAAPGTLMPFLIGGGI